MSSFIVYDVPTGAIRCAYSVSHSDDLAGIMAANTPSGASALAVEDGHAALANQSGWKVISGALVPVVPTDAQLLAKSQATQNAIIEASYQNATYNTPVSYMTTTFWTDQDSRNLLMGALVGYQMAGNTPTGFTWWDATGTAVPMTLTQLQGLYTTTLSMSEANFVRRKGLLASISSATTVAEVQAIVW